MSHRRLNIRVYGGLDALSGWGDATRRLQRARREKDKDISDAFMGRALEVLRAGDLDEIVDATLVVCPLCNKRLSSRERRLGHFVWGEDAAHYLQVHQMWPDELDLLLGYAAQNLV